MSERPWCPASGSDDAYTPDERSDTVKCHECGRWLYLTPYLRLPRHKVADV
jgi:hypothetical protein